jgi:hypothetical protein
MSGSETRGEFRRRCNSESLGDFRYDAIGHLLDDVREKEHQ